jgi:hypothetical protein
MMRATRSLISTHQKTIPPPATGALYPRWWALHGMVVS